MNKILSLFAVMSIFSNICVYGASASTSASTTDNSISSVSFPTQSDLQSLEPKVWTEDITIPFSKKCINIKLKNLSKNETTLLTVKNYFPNNNFDISTLTDNKSLRVYGPLSIKGDKAVNRFPILYIRDDAKVECLTTLTFKDAVLKMRPEAINDNEEEWLRPNVTVRKALNFEGEIHFEAEFDSKIKVGESVNVSKLDNTQNNFGEYYDFIAFEGLIENKRAVLDYYNPDDAEGITDIFKIKNADVTKKDLYIGNIQHRLRKLFVGDDALLKGLRFGNMKIYNYFNVMTPDIKKALTELKIVIEDIQ